MKTTSPLMQNADAYWWHYRVIGYAGNGSVLFNAVVNECGQPPLAEDLAEIEQMHERALRYPGVKTASTIGPFRNSTRRKPA